MSKQTYYIINNDTQRIHREPGRKSWDCDRYAGIGAAKAGVTRTIKFYEKAIEDVAQTVAEGKPDYYARRYNAYRDAVQHNLALRDTYSIVAVSDYAEPMVERVNLMTGKKYMEGINTPGYMSPSSEAYWSM